MCFSAEMDLAAGAVISAVGVGNLVVVALLAWLDRNAVVSLWCLWAAVTSIVINVHVRESGMPLSAAVGRRAGAVERQ